MLAPLTVKVSPPVETSSQQMQDFHWNIAQWLNGFSGSMRYFAGPRLLCQEKCLVVNKHQTRACKCCLLPERCLQRGCFGRSLLLCWWKAKVAHVQLVCKSVWDLLIFTVLKAHRRATNIENVFLHS